MKTYRGVRNPNDMFRLLVTVRGGDCFVPWVALDPRLDLRNHSPTGLEWGYGGSGPAQLALAILADCVGDELALRHYMLFKDEVVAKLPRDTWELSEQQIQDWITEEEEARRMADQINELERCDAEDGEADYNSDIDAANEFLDDRDVSGA